MKIPRDLSGAELIKVLCGKWSLERTREADIVSYNFCIRLLISA